MNRKRPSFLKGALSTAGQPSSKRLLAAFALLCALLLIIADVLIKDDTDFSHYFDGLLMFSAACLSITGLELFKK